MEALKFIFSSLWVFIGTCILIGLIFEFICDIVKIIKNK